MNREEIIRMARDAGLHLYVNDIAEEPYALRLERFAALVCAAEREACAQLAQNRGLLDASKEERIAHYTACSNIAAAIRARGQG